jgi:hypothetical protein
MDLKEVVMNTIKEIGLKVNSEETKNMLMVHQQNAGQNHNIKILTDLLKNESRLKYAGNDSKKSKVDTRGN